MVCCGVFTGATRLLQVDSETPYYGWREARVAVQPTRALTERARHALRSAQTTASTGRGGFLLCAAAALPFPHSRVLSLEGFSV